MKHDREKRRDGDRDPAQASPFGGPARGPTESPEVTRAEASSRKATGTTLSSQVQSTAATTTKAVQPASAAAIWDLRPTRRRSACARSLPPTTIPKKETSRTRPTIPSSPRVSR